MQEGRVEVNAKAKSSSENNCSNIEVCLQVVSTTAMAVVHRAVRRGGGPLGAEAGDTCSHHHGAGK